MAITKFASPSIFTFGDTIIVTIELRVKRYIPAHIIIVMLLIRRYLFHAFQRGLLFRGAFSIGHYIEDDDTNTVMGAAVADAASWYDKAAWMGAASTPGTNSILEHYCADHIDDIRFIHKYDVPLKGDKSFALYAISWPGLFHDEAVRKRGKNRSRESGFSKSFTSWRYQRERKFFMKILRIISRLLKLPC